MGSVTKSADLLERPEAEYGSASFRIQVLEGELMALKKIFKLQNALEGSSRIDSRTPSPRQFGVEGKKTVLRRRSLPGVDSCIGSIGWGSRKKHVSRLLKAIRKLRILGKGKTKRR